jgi:putative endonuclease
MLNTERNNGFIFIMAKQQSLGAYGEELAAKYLMEKGYTIVATNWHCRYGEIDIIGKNDAGWVFVEVKTRRNPKTENAFEGVTPQKQEKLVKAVQMYISKHNLDEVLWRVDIIAIALPPHGKPIIEHVENALDW